MCCGEMIGVSYYETFIKKGTDVVEETAQEDEVFLAPDKNRL